MANRITEIDPSEYVTCDRLNEIINDIDKEIFDFSSTIKTMSDSISTLQERNKYLEKKVLDNNYINRGINTVNFYNDSDLYSIISGNYVKIDRLKAITTADNIYNSIFDILVNDNLIVAYPLVTKADELVLIEVKNDKIYIDYYSNELSDVSILWKMTFPSFSTNVFFIDTPEYITQSIKINNTTYTSNKILLNEITKINEAYISFLIPKEYINTNTNTNLDYKYRYRLNINTFDICSLTTEKNIYIDFKVKKHISDYVLKNITFNELTDISYTRYNSINLSYASNSDNLLSSDFIDVVSIENDKDVNISINEYISNEFGYYRLFIDGGSVPIILDNLKITFKVR